MEQELDLIELWQIIAKRWIMIISLTLLAAAISAVVTIYWITPQYVASATLMVMKPLEADKILIQDIQVSRQLTNTYQVVVHSRRVLDKAIKQLSLPYTAEELKGKITVTAVKDTEIINIDVTDSNPRKAALISNQVSRSFLEEITDIMTVENVSIIDDAAVPTAPVSPRVRLNIAVAGLLGFMIAIGLAFLLHFLDRTIKSAEEIRSLLGLTVLGTIPVLEED